MIWDPVSKWDGGGGNRKRRKMVEERDEGRNYINFHLYYGEIITIVTLETRTLAFKKIIILQYIYKTGNKWFLAIYVYSVIHYKFMYFNRPSS